MLEINVCALKKASHRNPRPGMVVFLMNPILWQEARIHYTVFTLIGCMLLVSNKPFLMFVNDSFISFMILTLSSLYLLKFVSEEA